MQLPKTGCNKWVLKIYQKEATNLSTMSLWKMDPHVMLHKVKLLLLVSENFLKVFIYIMLQEDTSGICGRLLLLISFQEVNKFVLFLTENLEVALEPEQVQHLEVGRYFEKFCKVYYVPNAEKQMEYPQDGEVRLRFSALVNQSEIP